MNLVKTNFFVIILMLVGCSSELHNHTYNANDPNIVAAHFPGGVDAMKEFIKNKINWTQQSPDVEGTVLIDAVIDKDGSVTKVSVRRGLCETCDAEALRVARIMPNWIPATRNNQPVRSMTIIPVRFSLSGN